MAKSKTPQQETFFYSLIGTEHGFQPSLTTRDRELVSVLEVRTKNRARGFEPEASDSAVRHFTNSTTGWVVYIVKKYI